MGIPIKDAHLHVLNFVNDQLLIAQEEEDLGYMLRIYKKNIQIIG